MARSTYHLLYRRFLVLGAVIALCPTLVPAEQAGQIAGRARRLADSAYVFTDSDPERCRRIALAAVEAARLEKDDSALHDALNCVRYVHYLRHEHGPLLEVSTEAFEVARRLNSHRAMGDDLNWISVALGSTGQFAEAYERSKRAMVHMRLANDSTALGYGLVSLSMASEEHGRHGEAVMHALEAIRVHEAIGDEAGVAFARNTLAYCFLRQERWTDALPVLARAYRYTGVHGEEIEKAYLERDMGRCYAELGGYAQARALLDQAEDRIHRLGAVRELPAVLEARIALAEREGRTEDAYAAARNLLTLKDSLLQVERAEGYSAAVARAEQTSLRQQVDELAFKLAEGEKRLVTENRQRHVWKAATLIACALAVLLGIVIIARKATSPQMV